MPDYQTLGVKTFILFLLERIYITIILLVLAIGLFILNGQAFLSDAHFAGTRAAIAAFAWWLSLASIAAFFITLVVTWLIYKSNQFALGPDSLRIKRGVLNKEERAIPYRQIQNVDIDQDISFQVLGVARLVVTTAGEEDAGQNEANDPEGVLPALDAKAAIALRDELLRRANVEEVNEVNENPR